LGRNDGFWALSATASDADAASRAVLAEEFEAWVAAGGCGVALATCHRVELYGFGGAPTLNGLRHRSGEEAVAHLLGVAAGLESVIVGEDEVLHQVRDALRTARAARRVDPRLARLFEIAVATGRRARSRRSASSGNLAQNAVAWLRTMSNVERQTVVVGGAGHMGAALAHSLAQAGALVTVASRDPARASSLAHRYGGRGVGLADGAEAVSGAAAVAVALGGPWTELAQVPSLALPPIADISAPPSVPESVRGRLNGSFLGIDDLYHEPAQLPGAYMKDASRLVASKTAEYVAWLDRGR
jgi:glutamyl-tRNA reductase